MQGLTLYMPHVALIYCQWKPCMHRLHEGDALACRRSCIIYVAVASLTNVLKLVACAPLGPTVFGHAAPQDWLPGVRKPGSQLHANTWHWGWATNW